MSMSAHEPKSMCDNTKTERTKNIQKFKTKKYSPVTCQYATTTE